MVPRMRPSSAEATTDSFLRPALAGAAATFSGIGLARFAYVPLFPAMVGAGWISGAPHVCCTEAAICRSGTPLVGIMLKGRAADVPELV